LAGERPKAIYDSRDGLKGDQMFHMFEDSRGELFVSTKASEQSQFGMAKWDVKNDKFHAFSELEGLPAAKAPSSLPKIAVAISGLVLRGWPGQIRQWPFH